jgi:hypothetical protein
VRLVCARRTFSPARLLDPLVALAVYVADSGNLTVSNSASASEQVFATSSLYSSFAAPFVFLGTSNQFSMRFSYGEYGALRAVTTTTFVTDVATNISVLGPAYMNEMVKLWVIRAHEGFQVELAFTTLNLDTDYDFVDTYDGTGALSVLRRLTGTPSPLPTVTSTTRFMTVLFTTDLGYAYDQGYLGFATDHSFVRNINESGDIGCTGDCYGADLRLKW